MSTLHILPFISSLCILLPTVLAKYPEILGAPVHKHLPRCRCYPQEIIDISQSVVKCEDQLLEREQLYTDKPYRSFIMNNAVRSMKPTGERNGPSKLSKSLRKSKSMQGLSMKQENVNGGKQYNEDGKTKTEFPVVSYNLTYVGDDIVHIYIDGKLVTCDSTAPKRRIKVQLKDVPCTDLVIRVKNESPRCRDIGGAGIGVLVDYDGQTYSSVPADVQYPCEDDKDEDNYCFSADGKQVIPMKGYGAVAPADNCFPFVSYPGFNCNDCQVDRLDAIETCHLGYDPELAENESMKKPSCDPKTWTTPLKSADILSTFPLCEFVAMGRNGGFTVNPIDGFHRDDVVYGIRLELPFCNK